MKKIINKTLTVTGLLALSLIANSSFAKVSVSQAEQLGKTLTPLGAELAGNKAGTIPPWIGGLNSTNTIKSQDSGRPENLYKEDKPLFTISNDNLGQYKANLSAGQLAMFAKYQDYKMPIYQTRRSAAYPKKLYPVIKSNATSASLLQDGQGGLENFHITIPFPIPKTGLEVIWNHITRYRGGAFERTGSVMPVQADGSYNTIKMSDTLVWPEYFTTGRHEEKDDNVLFYYLQKVTAPARLTGSALLVHATIDQVKEGRRVWVYNSGQRRVRRAPGLAYDGPGNGSDGLRTADDYDMYNGSPDRYNWKLLGKKEMYIPYNANKLMDTDTKYASIINKGHLNSDYLRYELHRVWEVEATIKKGQRHIYAKRTFYIDEDTWSAAVIDQYDNRDVIWKLSEGHTLQFYDVDTNYLAVHALYDLVSGRYLVSGLSNEEPKSITWDVPASRRQFTSGALRRAGR